MTDFEIHEVHAIRNDSVLTLAFAGTADGANVHLILSLSERPNQQNINLGLVGIHAEWNDQAHSGYGIIRSARWDGPDLAIAATEAGQALGIPATVLLHKAAGHLRRDERLIADTILGLV